MERGVRLLFSILAFIAGVLVGNVGWVIPTAVQWGGGANTAACLLFPALAAVLMIIAIFAPEGPS